MNLRVLVAIHLVAAVLPLVGLIHTNSIWLMPVIWGALSVLVGQLMLLAFWAGLGTSHWAWRLTGTIAGTGYVAFWGTSPTLLSLWIYSNSSGVQWLSHFGVILLQSGVLVLILGGVFSIMGRWFSHLEIAADTQEASPTSRYQFSIQNLLVITTVTAVFLAGRRGSNEAINSWHQSIATVLIVGAFMINAIYAVRGTLRSGPIRWRLFLVLVVAVLLGTGIALISGIERVSWWLGAFFALAMTVPTLVVVASLLVVRSCGYRLIPNPPTRRLGVLNPGVSQL